MRRVQPFDPERETGVQYIARLEATINLMMDERLKLDRRIRMQRLALRLNWEIIEMRASYKRAWYPSPLLRSMILNRRKQPPWWRRMMTRAIYGMPANQQRQDR